MRENKRCDVSVCLSKEYIEQSLMEKEGLVSHSIVVLITKQNVVTDNRTYARQS
jgi:hypothetical protein